MTIIRYYYTTIKSFTQHYSDIKATAKLDAVDNTLK